MGLFGSGARRREEERQRLQASWRGRLNEELWNRDPSREAYVDTASGIEVEFAHAALALKLGEPLPKTGLSLANKLLPAFVPLHELSPVGDATRTAYLVSFGETWDQLDKERARQIARECCASAARDGMPQADESRFRSGSAISGLVSCHPEHSRQLTAFQPMYRHFAEQPAFQRLHDTAPHFGSQVAGAFFTEMSQDEHEEVRHSYVLAWHLGMAVWLWHECGFFDNPALSATAD